MSNHLRFVRCVARLALGCATVAVAWSPAAVGQTQYTASWTSLNQHTAAPEWFQDAKFGIYFHWGVYSVPAFDSEWYPRNMYDKSGDTDGVYNHHVATYGDPDSSWPYNNFMSGANDKNGNFVQFAPKLVSNGGNWDPNAWAQIFVNAGARYAGPSMEHHDGFSMWDSKVNPWNSVAYGPKLNLAQLHVNAFRAAGLKIVAALHTAYHFNGYYQWVPAQTDPNLQILYAQTGTANENDLWLGKIKEVVDEFQPDILWQDFDLNLVDPTHLLESLQYYYNAALGWGKEVVATYKDGYNNQGEVYDYERGGPAGITTPYWLTDDAIGVSSWCYTQGMSYYSPQAVLDAFIDRVSKGGNLLLNISPMWDGTIPEEQQTILSTMGSFLKQNGTAIYDTRAWTVYGEGPTKMGGGSFTNPTAGTSSDVRYTKSKDGSTLYAIWMGWPGDGKQVTMASVTTTAFPVGSGKVYLFGPTGGSAIELTFTQDGSGLHVTLPSTQPYTAVAYAMEISPSGTPPAPTPWLGSAGTDGGAGGAAGTGVAGGGTAGAGGSPGTGGAAVVGSGGAAAAGGAGAGGASVASSRGGTSGSGEGGAGGNVGTAGGGVSSGGRGAGGVAVGEGGVGGGGRGAVGGAAQGGSNPGGNAGTTTGPVGTSSGCSCTIQGTGRHGTGGSLLFLGLVLAALSRQQRAGALSSHRSTSRWPRPGCSPRQAPRLGSARDH
ncbi:MAG: alpha-L-fucosidase [Polyangia bacterium]